MSGRVTMPFDVTPEQRKWFGELAKQVGKTKIGLLWFLADTFAEQINFKPRPK
jgi:hypothetical protein